MRMPRVSHSGKYNLVFVVSELGCGGAQRVMSQIAAYWTSKGQKILLITFDSAMGDFISLPPEVDCVFMGVRGTSSNKLIGIFKNIMRLWRLRAAIKSSYAPVVISFLTQTNILTLIASIGMGLRRVVSERNNPKLQNLEWVWRLLRRVFYARASVITVNSTEALGYYRIRFPKQTVSLLPNPLQDLPAVVEQPDFSSPIILAVGRLHHQKGYDILLSAFARFRERFSEWELHFIGDGPERASLEQLARQYGLGNNIKFHGYMSDPASYYYYAEFMVLPSRYEGQPNVVLEAAQSGLPMIVSNATGGALEIVHHQSSGLVFPSENADALLEKMYKMASNKKLRDAFAIEAKKRVMRHDPSIVMPLWDDVVFGVNS